MTFDELKQLVPSATAETWRQLPGGGWAHVTARVGEGASVGARASVGAWASVGARASVGAWASVERTTILHLGHMGSRHDVLCAVVMDAAIYIGTGCFWGTIDAFEAAVNKSHGDNEHGRDYGAACRFIREWAAPRIEKQRAGGGA